MFDALETFQGVGRKRGRHDAAEQQPILDSWLSGTPAILKASNILTNKGIRVRGNPSLYVV